MFATDPGSDGPGIKTKVIQFADAAGSLLELFQDSTRRRTPEPLDNGLQVLDHSRFIADALRRDLQLPKTPEAFEVPILYGNPNPTSQFLNISQVGPISVTVKQNIPSSLAQLDLDSSLEERRLQFHYGNDAYQCMRSQHTSWQIVDDERGRQLKGEHSRLWPWNSNPPMLSSSSRCFASLSPSSRLSRSSLAFSKPSHPIPFVLDRVKTYLSSSAIRHRWVLLETS
ncbi:hypothetical protein FOXB_12654 [Fusarium oxysporum f. sp. conglutinans Fo5176]|uniref:Uncharacterized protein n=1 Tax=Fusarium oxysporum (strain Fo5176) TaxID=660025 RepID=F9G1X2_FUSOF|nr:hypothetical protein FOXB_12654 [Fusarium oxysporum f. sp. conglutinans Fo5176]